MSNENEYGRFCLEPLKSEVQVSLFNRVSISGYVVLEGNSGSGKTTLANNLEKRPGFVHIGEYGNYLDFKNGENFPNFPPKNINDVLNSNSLWPQIEIRRRSHQIEFAEKYPNSVQIVERSLLSLLAFEYAKKEQGVVFDIQNLTDIYSELYKKGILVEPSAYVFLKASPEIIRERVKDKKDSSSLRFLSSSKSVIVINEFIQEFLEKYVPKENYLIIDSGKIKSEDIIEKLVAFIEKLENPIKPNDSLVSFIYNVKTGRTSMF